MSRPHGRWSARAAPGEETLPTHERVAVAIRRTHHRKAEDAMRESAEVARQDTLHHRRTERG
jgi:GntR family transcriptional regulator, galactonate operon transcriptional repressor